MSILSCGKRSLDLTQTHLMGVLNVTPDSFSDGGNFVGLDAALVQAEQMLVEGASIIDVGGESTRPGAARVSLQEELDRVCPVIEQLVSRFDAVVSVDTSTPEVMSQSLALGVGMINDVRAFSRPGAVDAVKKGTVALCAMHMRGEPDTMQFAPSYSSVIDEVISFLNDRVSVLSSNGILKSRIVLDPGFGFGKTLAHNLALLGCLEKFVALGFPVLVGMSRKSMIGEILDKSVDERVYGSLACAVLAAEKGAHIIRVHDVAATKDAVRVVDAMKRISIENGEG